MQINLSGHHVEITTPLREYVTQKLERVIRHVDNVTSIQVILSIEKLRQKAEARLHVTGNDLYADATEEDMYAAIDQLVDKLDRQVKRYKEKLTDHHRNNAKVRSHM